MAVFEHVIGTYLVENGKAALAKGRPAGPAPTQDELRLVLAKLRDALDAQKRARIREANIDLTKKAIRESVTPDALIIQLVTNIEELDKVANRLAKRLRDWYALAGPELEHENPDHRAFAERVLEQARRPNDTMGGEIPEQDTAMLISQAQLLIQLYAQRDLLLEHLERSMQEHTPNLKRVAGAMIGAKLLALAGSLRRLAMMPAGTVQLLGAETALFRHLRNRSARPPKHGIIFNHPLLQRAQRKGRVARVLADCTAIAARVDYFKGEFVGDDLARKVEAA